MKHARALSVWAATLAIAADRYERQAGTIFGLLFAIGLIGGMFFPWIVGHLSQAFSVRSGMIVPLVGALIIAIISFSFAPQRGEKVPRSGG